MRSQYLFPAIWACAFLASRPFDCPFHDPSAIALPFVDAVSVCVNFPCLPDGCEMTVSFTAYVISYVLTASTRSDISGRQLTAFDLDHISAIAPANPVRAAMPGMTRWI
jgi:hypothetical protein